MDKKPHIYLISGLGADYRVFKKTNLPPGGFTHIEWIPPESKNESIQNYAKRLCAQIKHENPILMGVSFGGIITIEISKHISTSKVVLISSIKAVNELPKKYILAGKLNFTKAIPKWILNKNNLVIQHLFGIKSKEAKSLLKEIIKDSDTTFMKWAFNQIVKWDNKHIPKNIIHIHGDSDKLFPFKNCDVDYTVKGGEHFMVFENHLEVNTILSKAI